MNNMMPAGTYYVGDLCYVMHDDWDEFCDLTIVDNECCDGVFKLKSGVQFASFGTAYGDGTYTDNFGRKYTVDAGLIGCIALTDIDLEYPGNFITGGNIVTFEYPFVVSESAGLIEFGTIAIDTAFDEYDDEYDEE